LSCNLSEVLVIGLAVLSTLPLPLLPLQILYLNLVTDVFPAFALAMGEGSPGILKHPPRPPHEPLLGREQWITIVLHSLALTAGTFGAMALTILWLDLDGRSTVTVTFLTLAFAQLFHAFNMPHAESGLWRNEVTTNPWVWAAGALCAVLLAVPPYLAPAAQVLHLVPPSAAMWSIIIGLGIAPLFVTQTVMLLIRFLRARAE
jgi:Ca2+-transporting ATPase